METEETTFYHEISLTIPSLEVDPVSNYIIENICGGLLLEDEDDDSHTTIKFYVADGVDVESQLAGLKTYLIAVNPAHANIKLGKKRVNDLDWIESYKKSVVPVLVGESIVIKPPWSEEKFEGRLEIYIEPKMAFGTGRHESTRGSLAQMEKIELSDKTMLDLGCGSGVLGIYAAKQGAGKVIGYDIDPLAIENSVENYEINEVSTICRAFVGTLSDIPEGEKFDVIVVNIIKAVIVPIVGDLKMRLLPGGCIILSGLMDQDMAEVEAALSENGLDDFEIHTDNEWVTYLVRAQ